MAIKTQVEDIAEEKQIVWTNTFAERFNELLREIEPIKKNMVNTHFGNRYYNINSLLAILKPMLWEKGFNLKQPIIVENGKNVLHTVIYDLEGNWEESKIVFPDLQDPQKIASCISYYRRYSLVAMLCLESDDDDGNIASGHEKVIEYKKAEPVKNDMPFGADVCGKCGSPMKLSKKGTKYCSALCWMSDSEKQALKDKNTSKAYVESDGEHLLKN